MTYHKDIFYRHILFQESVFLSFFTGQQTCILNHHLLSVFNLNNYQINLLNPSITSFSNYQIYGSSSNFFFYNDETLYLEVYVGHFLIVKKAGIQISHLLCFFLLKTNYNEDFYKLAYIYIFFFSKKENVDVENQKFFLPYYN